MKTLVIKNREGNSVFAALWDFLRYSCRFNSQTRSENGAL